MSTIAIYIYIWGVWQEYFTELLNAGKKGVEEVHGGRKRFGNEGNGLLGEEITREEVVWALRKLKVKATTGKDGITADKMNGEVLVELWWERTNYCRRTRVTLGEGGGVGNRCGRRLVKTMHRQPVEHNKSMNQRTHCTIN